MIELAKEPLNSRICQTLLQDLGNDGGQYDMASNVIELYGMVPKTVYPESFNSSNSGKVNALLSTKLREFACEIRAAFAKFEDFAAVRFGAACSASEKRAYAVKACRAMKDKQMAQVYSLLSIALGAPPRPDEAFKWEFHDKTGKFQSWEGTPLDFYRASGFKAADGISLVHDPRHDPNQVMTVDRLGNVWTGRPVRYVNTKIEDMLDVTVSLLKQGKPVWFGCDVGQSSNSTHGLMVAGLHDFKDAFGGAPSMDKAERLNTGSA
jgi:bleomycin hydrolase